MAVGGIWSVSPTGHAWGIPNIIPRSNILLHEIVRSHTINCISGEPVQRKRIGPFYYWMVITKPLHGVVYQFPEIPRHCMKLHEKDQIWSANNAPKDVSQRLEYLCTPTVLASSGQDLREKNAIPPLRSSPHCSLGLPLLISLDFPLYFA